MMGPDQHFFSPDKLAVTIKLNRGGRLNEKCPILSSDLVLIHNHIMEALGKPDTEINKDYDFWAAVLKLTDQHLEFCRAFASRARHSSC